MMLRRDDSLGLVLLHSWMVVAAEEEVGEAVLLAELPAATPSMQSLRRTCE